MSGNLARILILNGHFMVHDVSRAVERLPNPSAQVSEPGAWAAAVHDAADKTELIGRVAAVLSDVIPCHL